MKIWSNREFDKNYLYQSYLHERGDKFDKNLGTLILMETRIWSRIINFVEHPVNLTKIGQARLKLKFDQAQWSLMKNNEVDWL